MGRCFSTKIVVLNQHNPNFKLAQRRSNPAYSSEKYHSFYHSLSLTPTPILSAQRQVELSNISVLSDGIMALA